MKKFLLLITITATAFILKAQNSQTPYLTKSLSSVNVQQVHVETSGGSIAVTGVDPSQAKIEVYIRGNNGNGDLSSDEIKKRLENYTIDITTNNNTLTAVAKNKARFNDWKRGLSISFKIYVPKNVATDLSTSGGSIRLANLSGNQEFRTSGGSLNVDNVSGKVDGKTSGGSVNITNSKDDIDLSTSGGSIEASNCNGNIRLSTSGGSLKLAALQGKIKANTSGGTVNANDISGELSAHTSGGSVRMKNLSCSLETSTSGGNIDVQIEKLGDYVRISNSGGDIDLHLPQNKGLDLDLNARKISTGTLNNFNGKTDDDQVYGKVNGGGIPVEVKAGSGRINIMWD
ncbi:MAG: DUF4097 family beta strand repeat-containing protein [Ilyomonas sp.]